MKAVAVEGADDTSERALSNVVIWLRVNGLTGSPAGGRFVGRMLRRAANKTAGPWIT